VNIAQTGKKVWGPGSRPARINELKKKKTALGDQDGKEKRVERSKKKWIELGWKKPIAADRTRKRNRSASDME